MIDCGWIKRGGADPAAELARYADCIQVTQTKDVAPMGPEIDDGWDATGDGTIDWKALALLFRGTNVHHLCTEHDTATDWKTFAKRSYALASSPERSAL